MLLAVSMEQGSLVFRLPAASGAASGSEALVSRFPAFLATSTLPDPLASDALALLLSILLYCRVPYHAPGLASPSSLFETGDQ